MGQSRCCHPTIKMLVYSVEHHSHTIQIMPGTCQNLDILMVQNSTLRTGMHLQLYQTSTMTLSTLDVIPNHYLPPECGDQNQRCGILNFEYSGISYYIIPSIRGFVTLSLYINNTQEPQKSFIDITEECNPIKAFYAGPEGRYHIVIACMDLQTRPRGIIYYLQYYFNVGRGSVIKNAELLTLSEPIYNPETVSEIIYVRGQQRCAEYDNLYFIDDAYVLHYPSDTFDPEFISSNDALQNCIGYQNIEYYGMNDYLLIRCSNNRTVLYDSCASHFTYQSPDRVPYPCSNGPDMIIYRNGSQLTFKHQHNNDTQGSQLLPFGELTYGTCIHTQGDVPTFIGIANDGTVFIVHFGDRISNINHVSFPKGSISYDGPIFTESRQAFGVYNVTSKEFLVINVTVECTQYPILHHISLSDHFSPDLIAINVRKGSYNCSCQKLETHHPPIRKWLRFGIPAIIFSALLFMVFGGATLVFIA